MEGYADHRFVCGQFRQRCGVDAVDFKKIDGGLQPGALVAVKVGLAFSDVEGQAAAISNRSPSP